CLMTRDVDTAALRCFVTAVRTGSMGRAAEVLGRTQPAISQQLRRLEDILDCSLLRRSASGVVMTPEGEAFLPLAERILALNDEAQAHVRSRAGRDGGRRRIGLLEDIAASGLQMALADFAHVHPELELDVTVADGDAMRDAYRTGKLDLVLSDSLLVGRRASDGLARWSGPRRRRSTPQRGNRCHWCCSAIPANGGCGPCGRSIAAGAAGARRSRAAALSRFWRRGARASASPRCYPATARRRV